MKTVKLTIAGILGATAVLLGFPLMKSAIDSKISQKNFVSSYTSKYCYRRGSEPSSMRDYNKVYYKKLGASTGECNKPLR